MLVHELMSLLAEYPDTYYVNLKFGPTDVDIKEIEVHIFNESVYLRG